MGDVTDKLMAEKGVLMESSFNEYLLSSYDMPIRDIVTVLMGLTGGGYREDTGISIPAVSAERKHWMP